jgi:hypothetical protein
MKKDRMLTTLKNIVTESQYLNPYYGIHTQIDSDLFEINDIKEVIINQEDLIIYVRFKGINGSIPFRFLTLDARNKVISWQKVSRSPLWKILNI